ncbi:MAG: hypothetical protein ACFCU4_06910 [Puniceicoccaceae bacterium]
MKTTSPTPLRDRSDEPGAGKPHAGICEGASRQQAAYLDAKK